MGGKVLEHEAKTILRQGIEQGTLASLKSLMRKMHMTAEQAMDALDIPEAEREKYRKSIDQ